LNSEGREIDPRDSKHFYYSMNPFRAILTFLLARTFSLIMKFSVEGLENLPLDGPVIIAANHLTNFDVFPMQFSLPRPIFFMGKAELFNNPVMDYALRNLGAFPVYRGEKDQWALEHARSVLDHGAVLGMFPEGTRSKSSGLGVAKTGTARLAIDKGCPIVPMLVMMSDRFFMHFPRRTSVSLNLLPPILPYPDETPLTLTDRLMFTMAAALPVSMRGVYAEIPKGFGN
jgi:1-acyl-sn-glycerol-3-phosphate acyltransferase